MAQRTAQDMDVPTKETALHYLHKNWQEMKTTRGPAYAELEEVERRWTDFLLGYHGMPQADLDAEYEKARDGGPSL